VPSQLPLEMLATHPHSTPVCGVEGGDGEMVKEGFNKKTGQTGLIKLRAWSHAYSPDTV